MEQIDLRSTGYNKLDADAVRPERKYTVELFVIEFGPGSWFAVTCILSQIPVIAVDRTTSFWRGSYGSGQWRFNFFMFGRMKGQRGH